MEEVDNIILNSLRECGCDFAEEVSSLSEFSTENVVESTVRCLRVINPELRMSHSLPPGMSARFRIGTSLAQACQAAGYRGDVGYQTFLYSSEADIRRLFMFLVEKLPRKKDESVEQPSGKASVLRRNIARVVKDQMASVWLPHYCKKRGIRWTGDGYSIEGTKGTSPFLTDTLAIPENVAKPNNQISKEILDYYRTKLPFAQEQVSCHSNLIPSLLEWNASELSRQQEWESEFGNIGLRNRSSLEEYRKRKLGRLEKYIREQSQTNNVKKSKEKGALIGGISMDCSFSEVVKYISNQTLNTESSASMSSLHGNGENVNSPKEKESVEKLLQNNRKIPGKKPPIPKKPTVRAVENHIGSKTPGALAAEIPSEETEDERMERIEKKLDQEVVEISKKLESMELEIHHFQDNILQSKKNLESCEESNKTVQEKVKLQKKTLALLPNAEENIAKLETMVETNQKRMVSLGQQWDKHRIPLLEKYEELKEKSSKRQTQSERKLEEIKLVRQRIKESTDEMKRKEQLDIQLTAEYGEMKRDVSRKSYTKKIFEIVANIRKQKEQIDKTLCDIRTLQKEINQLEGRVERTFTAADDVIFADAKKDDSVRQTYKYLAALSTNCTQLLNTVEATGGVMREIRDLENQIATEREKNTAENLKRITGDYKEMKKENNEMMKKVKSISAPSPKSRKKNS